MGAHGLSPSWAVVNMKLKIPLRVLSWFLITMGIFFLIFGYHVQNRDRMASNGGGLRGFFQVRSEKSRRKKKKKKKSSKRSKRSSSRRRKSQTGDRDRDKDIELAPTGSSEFGNYESPISSML